VRTGFSRFVLVVLAVASTQSAQFDLRSQDLVLNEIHASNELGIVDEDGEANDWIELWNRGSTELDLDGWALTDDPGQPTRWIFPATRVSAGNFVVVFASGKDRRPESGELHTSFSLSTAGEYLALIAPDGSTIVDELAPTYPPQRQDVSFGRSQDVEMRVLVDPASAAQWTPVTTDPAADWMALGFDARAWDTGVAALGFDADDPGGGEIENVARGRRASQSSTAFAGLASRAVDGSTNGDFAQRSTSHTSPAGDEAWWEVDLGEDRAISRIVIWNRTDCCAERLTSFRVVVLDAERRSVAASEHFTDRSAPPEPSYTVEPELGSRGRFVRIERIGPDRNGEMVLSLAEVEVFEGSRGVGPFIGTDVATTVHGTTASILVRVPFRVDGLADGVTFDRLVLRARYDDGFVAWIDGVEFARRNAPEGPARAAVTAPGARPDDAVGRVEEIDLSVFAASLGNGEHVLAFWALNAAADDDDSLITAELTASRTSTGDWSYFPQPTPGAANTGSTLRGFVADTQWSHRRGLYDAPIDVEISTLTPGAEIRYTVDGSAPTTTTGTVYETPIRISRTSIVRAAAFLDGYGSTNVDTQSYLYLAEVIRQTGAGQPATWGGTAADYSMDPNVVDHPSYRDTIASDLATLPVLSIVLDPADLFGPRGIYSNPEARGRAWERRCSIELFYPPDSRIRPRDAAELRVDAGLRIFGFGWRAHSATLKHSFRLFFRREYGAGKLEFPFFPDWDVERFNQIILRSQGSRGWNDFRTSIENTQYIHDAWARYTAREMGKLTTSSTYVQLYLNGLYWGLYNPVERPDAEFMAEHLGGDEEDYDALNARVGSIEVIDGSREGWDRLLDLSRRASTLTVYEEIVDHGDIDNLIDYMLINFYAGNRDWPGANGNNMRIAGGPPELGGYRFFCWDFEYSIWGVEENSVNVITTYPTPALLHSRLRSSPEYRLRFADHVRRHLFGEGALTPERTAARWLERAHEIDRGIVGESARWGDRRREPPYTRDVEWVRERDRLTGTFFPQRSARVIAQLRQAGLYPNVAAPELSRPAGSAPRGALVEITGPGTILYTVDGTDPRVPGGAVADSARIYERPIALERSVRIAARSLDGETWSALTEAVYFVDGTASLRVSEIMYHPPADFVGNARDREDYEYIELVNVSDEGIDLEEYAIHGGISIDALSGRLEPRGVVVVVADLEAFVDRYGTERAVIAGEYRGRLANFGDSLRLVGPLGELVLDFAYDDSWEPSTDGAGFSLVHVDIDLPRDSWSDAKSWRPSGTVTGTPGVDENRADTSGQIPGDATQDGKLDISDPVRILRILFAGEIALACEGDLRSPGNRALHDVNGDQATDLTDAIALLSHLFLGGREPTLGSACTPIDGCPNLCGAGR
jgi:hypothetical protein